MIDVTARLKACPDTNGHPAKRALLRTFVRQCVPVTNVRQSVRRYEDLAGEAPAPRQTEFSRFFRALPQTIPNVHRIRTAALRILIANPFNIGDIAFTAGVTVTLPVIAQGWFCDSFPQGLRKQGRR